MPFMKERLKERRLALDITLHEVAESIGVQEATVQRYESGVIHKIDTLTVEKLAQAVKCSPAYLMGWTADYSATSGIQVNGSISSSQVVNASNSSNINLSGKTISSQAMELVEIFEGLDLRRQHSLVSYALRLSDEVKVESSS